VFLYLVIDSFGRLLSPFFSNDGDMEITESTSMPLTILIVDDSLVFRKGLSKVFEFTKYKNSQLLEALNGRQAYDIATAEDVDVIILDERMPEMRGFESAKAILAIKPGSKIIALTQYDETALIMNYFKIGVKGFLSKDEIEIDVIEQAVESVVAGNYYFRTKYDKQIRTWLSGSLKKSVPAVRFSGRELQLVIEISKGNSNKEIASNLGIGIRTIETYRLDLIKKIGVKNTSDLLSYVYKNGII
jgi:DNA-binding NarL/FixJ family response regulator